MTQGPPLIALTPGDPAGIGPEITWKAIRARADSRQRTGLICVGAKAPFEKLAAPVVEVSEDELLAGARPPSLPFPFVWLLPAPIRPPRLGLLRDGFQSGWSIETAVRLVLKGAAHALVTGPIHKDRLQKGGYDYIGHTEMLANLCGIRAATMMMANDLLRVSLVTTHVALKSVPSCITAAAIRRTVLHTAESLRSWWGIKNPRIAVAALNPHAGESNLLGTEESRIIVPTVARLKRASSGRFDLTGPISADTLFANNLLAPKNKRYDAVVCMYHDQGLIPVKLLDFHRTVNITLGLPMVRTSVDHGVGFDIAGRGVADDSSLRSAITLATRIVYQGMNT